ncbi:hypothetical protein JXJ21_14185 [candidate division KSB1 bacterium]|nr:hypothetical protein [candidate division KSB1 bacterium]
MSVSRSDVELSHKRFKSYRCAAGIDKVSIKMFEQNRDENLTRLMNDLKRGNYQPLL